MSNRSIFPNINNSCYPGFTRGFAGGRVSVPDEISDENVYAKYLFDSEYNHLDESGNVLILTDVSKNLVSSINLITNPSFTVNTTGWLQSGNHTISRYTSDFYSSPASANIVSSGSGDLATNRIRFSVGFSQYNVYKIVFYAKSLGANINLVTTDSNLDYQKTHAITNSWQKFEYIFTKRNTAGSVFILWLTGAGSILIDDVHVGILDGKHLIHPLIGDGNLPIKELNDIFYVGTDNNYALNFNPISVSAYFVGETFRNNISGGLKVLNRLIDIGYISSNVLTIGNKPADSWLTWRVKLKELIIRNITDDYNVKNKINKYLSSYHHVSSSSFTEKINRDRFLSKITPYISDANKFIFCACPDFHISNTWLPTVIDLIQYYSSLDAKVKFVSAHGDVRYKYETVTDAQFITNIEANLHPYIGQFNQPLFFAIGNHDVGIFATSDESLVGYQLTNAQQQANYVSPLIVADPNIQIDSLNPDGRYYYRDYDVDKIRVIVLNQYDTSDVSTDGINFDYPRDGKTWSQEQLTWLSDVALNLPDLDYHVVIFAHDPLIQSDTAIVNILTAFKTNTSFNVTINAYGRSFSLSKDFNEINGFNGVLVGVFLGHNHIPDQTFSNNIWWITNIGTDSLAPPNWDRSFGSIGQQAADFVMIDKSSRNIYMLRYGCEKAIDGNPNDNGDRGFANNDYDQIMIY